MKPRNWHAVNAHFRKAGAMKSLPRGGDRNWREHMNEDTAAPTSQTYQSIHGCMCYAIQSGQLAYFIEKDCTYYQHLVTFSNVANYAAKSLENDWEPITGEPD